MNAPSTVPPSPAAPAIEFYTADGYATDESVGHLMRRIMLALAHEIELGLEPDGLTNAQWAPLFKLALGCGSTAAELARECALDAGAMTRLLDRLEGKGLCRRVRSSEDRRVVHLEVTDEGREAVKAVPVVLSRVQNEMLAGFTVEEWQALRGYLRRMLDNVRAVQARRERSDA